MLELNLFEEKPESGLIDQSVSLYYQATNHRSKKSFDNVIGNRNAFV